MVLDLHWRAATGLALSILIVGGQLLPYALAQLTVPDVAVHRDAWLLIESKERTHTIPEDLDDSAGTSQQHVRQYFSLKMGGKSILTLESPEKGETLTQLSNAGRYYLITQSDQDKTNHGGELKLESCHLDHRHDHTAVFPWRHVSAKTWFRWLDYTTSDDTKGARKDLMDAELAGLAGLWLNLSQDKRTKCQLVDKQRTRLLCAAKSDNALLNYEIVFEASGDKKILNKPTRARVVRSHSIHVDQTTVLQQATLEADIREFRLIDEQEAHYIEERFERLLALCKSPEKLLFPSLLRQVAESAQRTYYFAYSVSLFELPEALLKGEKLLSKQNVQEWFSYELATQTISRCFEKVAANTSSSTSQLGSERYLRLFNIMRDSSVNYKILSSSDSSEALDCEFGSLDADTSLSSGSRLLRRPMEFHKRGVKERHRGQIIGLGALLMNVADIHHKRANELQHEVRLGPRNNYQSLIEWQVDDFADTGQRWFLYFKKPTLKQLADHESSIGDLTRIELRHKIALKSQPASFFHGLAMLIEISDFTNSLYQDEIDRAFQVAASCPEAEDVKPDESNEAQINLPKQQQEAQEEAVRDDPLEFPSFDELLGLDQNYKISSRWKFLLPDLKVDTELRVTEYLNTEVESAASKGRERSLFSRLDVTLVEPETESELDRTRFFLYHSINLLMMCRDSKKRCSQIYHLDNWLMVLSSEMSYHFDSIQIDQTGERLRHFGLGAIWSLASGTDLVEPQAQTEDGKFVWSLEGELFDKEAKILFQFKAEGPIQVGSSDGSIPMPHLTFDSLRVHSNKFSDFTKSGSHLLMVDDIVVRPGAAQPEDFNLPDYCREAHNFADLNRAVKALLSADPDERRANFLTFRQAIGLNDEANHDLSLRDLKFKLTYELIVLSEHPALKELVEQRFQVTEMNWAHLERALLSLKMQNSPDQSVQFWSLGRDVRLIEQVQHSECKQAPDLETLFQLADHLDLIEGKKVARRLDFLLAHLWDAFGKLVMDPNESNKMGELIMSKQSSSLGGKQLHTIHWSLFGPLSNLIVFEFLEPQTANLHLPTQLELNSISLSLNGHKRGTQLRFMLKSCEKFEQVDELKMSPSPVCEQLSRDGELFPKLSDLLHKEEIIHMRSELVVPEEELEEATGRKRQKKRIYLLDEWLQSERAYRARLSLVKGANETEAELKADCLMNFESDEYFDLSQAGRCKMSPVDGQGLDYVRDDSIKCLGLGEKAQMVSHLFHSESAIFYGPLSVWTLAEYVKQVPLNNNLLHPLDLLDLSDPTKVDRWFQTNVWLLEHPQKQELTMQLVFGSIKSLGRHLTTLQGVTSTNWHHHDTSAPFSAQVVNYNFASALKSGGPKVEVLLQVPKGFGCKRNAKAKSGSTSKDVIMFNELSPLEFEYEASMSVVSDYERGTSNNFQQLAVIQTGWFGRCPSSWDLMLIGALRVNRQQHHFLDGTIKSRLRVASRDVGASNTITRTVDEASGSCSIRHLPAATKLAQSENEREVLVLDFGPDQIHLRSELFAQFERGSGEFERIQEFSEAQPDGGLVTTLVYESQRKELKLNDRLKGEGSIVKTFQRARGQTKTLDIFNYHTSFQLELIILNRAHLKLSVSGLQFRECHEIIRAARAQECFMDDEDSASTASDQSLSHAHLQQHFESDTKHEQRLRSFLLKFEPQEGKQITLEQFANEKARLERYFMRVLLSSPGQVPAMQLGHFRLVFEKQDSSIWGHFNLLEPASLRHSFTLLEGQELKQQPKETSSNEFKLTGQLARTSSLAKCADLCEKQQRKQAAGRLKCIAFSYCRNRFCQTLLGPSERLSSEADLNSKRLTPNLQSNSNCQVFHGEFLELTASRRYIDELVEFVWTQQNGKRTLLSNKYVLNVRLEDNTFVRFVGRQLDELTAVQKETFNEELDEEPTSEQLALVSKNSDLIVLNLDSYSKYANLETKVMHTSRLQACHRACNMVAAGCSLVSYCDSTQICTIISNITTWNEYRDLLNFNIKDEQNSCTVYSQNFLTNFEQFERTHEPKEFARKEANFNLQQCAAYCQLRQSDMHSDCLSFDFCHSPGKNPVCYLQTMHLLMDDFDESILEQTEAKVTKLQQEGPLQSLKQQTLCSHYSRSLVADFELKEKRKFLHHQSIVFQRTQLEQCALICRRDETCLAFEYCYLEQSHVSTCYLERTQASSDKQEFGEQAPDQSKKLENSTQCNVYELKKSHYEEDKGLTWQLELNLKMASLNISSREEVPATNTSLRFDSLLIVAATGMITGLLMAIVHAKMTRKRRVGAKSRRPSSRLYS